jgi:hypothetical protein
VTVPLTAAGILLAALLGVAVVVAHAVVTHDDPMPEHPGADDQWAGMLTDLRQARRDRERRRAQ